MTRILLIIKEIVKLMSLKEHGSRNYKQQNRGFNYDYRKVN